MRHVAFAVVSLATWALLLLWAAGADWNAPMAPDQRISIAGANLHVVIGGGAIDEDRLRVGAVGDDQSALQSTNLSGLSAADFPVLRYHLEQFPRTLELSFVFRRADAPDDVKAISLPWPDDREATFDLSDVPEWRGSITEIGFAEYPTPQLVPPALGFKPFTLVRAELWSPSWRGDLAALATDWFAKWPWSQRSVHALGRDTDTPHARSPVLTIALAIAANILWAWGILRLRGRPLMIAALGGVLVGWLLLDLRWQDGLWWRHASTRAIYADRTLEERQKLVPDTDVADAAARALSLLRSEPENARVLVHSTSPYTVLRLVHHLLPRNVGVLAEALNSGAPIPNGLILIVYDADGWEFDATRRALVGQGMRVPGILLLDDGRLKVLRTRGRP